MAGSFEAYTPGGLLTATPVDHGRLADLLAQLDEIAVTEAILNPLGGGPAPAAPGTIGVDDLLVVIAPPETVTPVHSSWHPIELEIGPYAVVGELPAQPGFDPKRALARPSGPFVLLARVTVSGRDVGLVPAPVQYGYAWVNRYAVESVTCDIELGVFFPGSRVTTQNGGQGTAGQSGFG